MNVYGYLREGRIEHKKLADYMENSILPLPRGVEEGNRNLAFKVGVMKGCALI